MSGRVWVVGALGRMGRSVRAALEGEPALSLGAALEAPGHPGVGREIEGGVRVTDDAKQAASACDVAIDFSVPAATLANLRVAADAGLAYVTGTTGFSEAERAELAEMARRIPVLHAPNFSLSVNLLAWLTREAARRLPGFDAEIVELHHAAKRDAPSGTALRLAEAVAEGRGVAPGEHLVLERAGEIGARPEGAIGVQTLRGGDNPGEHSVLFVGAGERLELHHRSHTRDHFARGAVRAAAWLVGREPGLHRLEEMLGL
ncbi:MAG: 4-hydroxy-tetrahydrodipicolinate reductase [Myxococcota bacterium]